MPANPLWRQLLRRPPPRPRKARADAAAQHGARVVVLEQGRSPSGDYLLRPWLAAQGAQVVCVDSREPPRAGQVRNGDQVVIVRYLPPAWRRQLDAQRGGLAELVYFMDDDLLDAAVLPELPRAYAQKIERLALAHRSWLLDQATMWVSTSALAAKYQAWQPVVLPMAPPAALLLPRQAVSVVYHGTASHQAEIEWLHPVLAAVQSRCPDTRVEVFGDWNVYRLYRDLPRTSVLHPMSWENYLAYTASHRADIGLAPILPGRFNAGRGPTKFYDYTRLGAVGLYADGPPYAGVVRDGVDGLLLPPDPGAWADAICALAQDAARREALRVAAQQRVGQHRTESG